ncbi:MAG TPA: peptide MFS transporter [Vicinamibacterales bacterium]|jgi:POT family proton-dependent oligopeptide transporter|nr:peptide MFS transporter [Vicinamibacterales bacterium]
MAQRGFFGHPGGLSTLFFTEMWERFSYYGMRALLILFMTAPAATGGLELDVATASGIYGMYIAMVYMMSLPGGWIADRLIGQRRAVLYGGILIACGHFSMAVPAIAAFYLGLVLIVLGTGLLKPNVSAMVGQIYEPNDTRRDAGFSLFYMGINLGAFFSPLVCGYLGQRINWHYGFASAGVGMTFGLIQYVLGGRRLGDAGLHPVRDASAEAQARFERRAWSAIAIGLALLVALGVSMWRGWLPLTAGQISDGAGYLLLILTVVFFAWLFLSGDWTREERRRLYVIGVFFLAASLFWSIFEQAGSTLNLFADRASHNVVFGRPFPSSWYQSTNPIFIILFAPVMAWLWIKLGPRDPSSPVKFSIGLLGVGLGFLILVPAARLSASGTLVSPLWLTATYFVHTIAELCLSPVGLSSMTKLAPARIVGLMMGVWFLATSVGNYIGGQLSGLYESLPLTALFGRVGLFAVIAGVVMLAFAPKFTKLMGGVK